MSCVDSVVFTLIGMVIAAVAFVGWVSSLALAFLEPEEEKQEEEVEEGEPHGRDR